MSKQAGFMSARCGKQRTEQFSWAASRSAVIRVLGEQEENGDETEMMPRKNHNQGFRPAFWAQRAQNAP
jgi:hypothetical protein